MPYPPNYHFVRQSGSGSGSGANSVTMADSDVGDCLIAVMAATATTNDFTALPDGILDTLGNQWFLYSTHIGHSTTADVFNAVGVYCCWRALGGGYTLDMPTQMQPADVLNTWM